MTNDHRDGLRVVLLDHTLPELEQVLGGTEERWARWLDQHGLPAPEAIPLDSKIVCDDLAHTVSCEAIVRDSAGRAVIDRDGEDRAIRRRTVTVQLEAPALPWPIPVGFTHYRTHGAAW